MKCLNSFETQSVAGGAYENTFQAFSVFAGLAWATLTLETMAAFGIVLSAPTLAFVCAQAAHLYGTGAGLAGLTTIGAYLYDGNPDFAAAVNAKLVELTA